MTFSLQMRCCTQDPSTTWGAKRLLLHLLQEKDLEEGGCLKAASGGLQESIAATQQQHVAAGYILRLSPGRR